MRCFAVAGIWEVNESGSLPVILVELFLLSERTRPAHWDRPLSSGLSHNTGARTRARRGLVARVCCGSDPAKSGVSIPSGNAQMDDSPVPRIQRMTRRFHSPDDAIRRVLLVRTGMLGARRETRYRCPCRPGSLHPCSGAFRSVCSTRAALIHSSQSLREVAGRAPSQINPATEWRQVYATSLLKH